MIALARASGRRLRCRAMKVLLLAGLVLLAGCAAPREPRLGTTRPTVAFLGEEFHVTLNADPASGYGWRLIRQPNPRVARVLNARYIPPAGLIKRGHDVWTCEATGRGTTRIIWHYLPRGDTNYSPARIFICAVEVR
jgi:predicted secreted protein